MRARLCARLRDHHIKAARYRGEARHVRVRSHSLPDLLVADDRRGCARPPEPDGDLRRQSVVRMDGDRLVLRVHLVADRGLRLLPRRAAEMAAAEPILIVALTAGT